MPSLRLEEGERGSQPITMKRKTRVIFTISYDNNYLCFFMLFSYRNRLFFSDYNIM
jgi:hypothetical protein